MGFIVICSTVQVEPTRELFNYFFTTNRDLGGWISISPRIVKDGNLIVAKERPDPKIRATSLMLSGGSKDSDDWKERFVFIQPRTSGSLQGVWSVSNGWTLDTKCKRPSVEVVKESAYWIMAPNRDWKED